MRSQNVPYWPERLTRADATELQPNIDLWETPIIRQAYVADNGVGPCAMIFDDSQFVCWIPALTEERAERYAGTY